MEDVLILYQATLLVLKNFLLAVIFAVFGLTYIYFVEKKDKHKKKVYLGVTRKDQ